MNSYLTFMDTISLSCTIFELLDSKIFGFEFDLWRLNVSWGRKKLYYSKAHIWLPIWLLWTPSLYLVPFSIYSTSKCSRFDHDHWTLKVIWYLVSKKFKPLESPYMTFYLTSIDNISVSRTVFEKFDFKVFMVCPWPLTPKNHLGSKFFIAFESPYMTSYLTSMDNISQFRTVFEIFDSKVFRVRPWPLNPESPPGSKILIPFESPYTTSYLTSMDTIYLSRTALEIFNFKVFRVWPWFLTPKGHRGSKNFIPFGNSYMTSDLTSMNTISLSRTFHEIFDFKVFRVWPWPLFPKGHLESKLCIPFGSPYMTSYLTSMNTISLSRTVLEIFDFKVFRVWTWPLTPISHLGSKNLYTIRKPIYDFLFDFYEHHLSISYRSRDIRLQSF